MDLTMKSLFTLATALVLVWASTEAADAQNNLSNLLFPPPTGVLIKPPKPKYMILPPVQYDKYYEGDLTIRIVQTLDELLAACRGTNRMWLACSMVYEKNCIIYMLPDETTRKHGWTTGLLLRHEMGHCNGWRGDHPGERAISWPSTHW